MFSSIIKGPYTHSKALSSPKKPNQTWILNIFFSDDYTLELVDTTKQKIE